MKKFIPIPLHIPTLIFCLVIASLYVLMTNFVSAQDPSTEFIQACVNMSNPTDPGNVRIIGANDNCGNSETKLKWIKGVNIPPAACPGCNFSHTGNFGNTYSGKDLTDSYFDYADFSGADLSGANFTNASLSTTNFSAVNLANVNFTNANLEGALNVQAGQGIIWSNTTCPDGTNSNNNNNTCEGHLSF